MEFELPVPGTLGSNEITKEKQRVSEALARVEAQRETVPPALLGHSSTATFL